MHAICRGCAVAGLHCHAGIGPGQAEGPQDAKAQKTYNEGLEALKQHRNLDALDKFKKADKQDGGHCLACQKKMIKYGSELGEWKTAELAGEEMVAQAQGEDAGGGTLSAWCGADE